MVKKKKGSNKKKAAKKKKASKKKKKVVKKKKTVKKAKGAGERVVAKVEHFFGHISVAAFKLKFPLKVGDVIHVKGHTTDFVQRVDSMQIEHESVSKAKKGQDIGIRVKGKVRQGDTVFISAKGQGIVEQSVKPVQSKKPMFPTTIFKKPPVQAQPSDRPAPKPNKANPYSGTKFLSF